MGRREPLAAAASTNDVAPDQRIVLFDGVCNLCNASVQFIIRHDRHDRFRFCSLQSETGQRFLRQFHLPADEFTTFVLIDNGDIYTRSTAALRVLRFLGGWPAVAYMFILVPRRCRDWVYGKVAQNRYVWFGKKDTCMIPTPSVRRKFIE